LPRTQKTLDRGVAKLYGFGMGMVGSDAMAEMTGRVVQGFSVELRRDEK
jgi:hypothetical protein